MRATVLALVLATVGACGDDGGQTLPDAPAVPVDALPPDAAPREVIMSTQPLQPLELVEGIMTAKPTDRAVIKLTAAGKIGWNIHGHAGGSTQVVHEERGVDPPVDYVFVPPAAADWYLLVRNESQQNLDVTIRVELYGEMTWRWQ